MTDMVTQVLKATLITSENFEIIKTLSMQEDLYDEDSVVPGNYMVSLTLRVANPFVPGLLNNSYQTFWFVMPEVLNRYFKLVSDPEGTIGMQDAEQKFNPKIEYDKLLNQTPTFEEETMGTEMTVSYILFMIDRYGSRTREVLMEYGQSSKDILTAYKKAVKEGYLEHDGSLQKPFLTREGRQHLSDYYGNDINGYDE